jgi:ionotropic glutamate receptor
LGALVLVCAYNSLLITYILGSNAYPLVDSIKNLVEKPDVKLVVDRGLGVDMVISVIQMTDIEF